MMASIPSNTMQKAWAFYRRSTEKQDLSVYDQRRDCQVYAAANSLEIIREFVPSKGYASGLTIDRDSTFLEMIRLAEQGGHGVRILLVYDVSRLGRLVPESKIYWEQRLKRQGGMQVIYVKDSFLNDGSIGDVLSKVVKHSEAHQFSVKLSELTLRGSKSHSALGHFTGGKSPFGYDRLLVDMQGNPVKRLGLREHKADKLQRVMLIPNPSERLVVNQIFEKYVDGDGLNRIVADLNSRKVPSPRGSHWTKSMVHYLLRNRTYLGERIYNKRSYKGWRRGEKGSLFNPRDQWIVKVGAYEPLIDPELFQKVQAKLPTRSIGQGRSYHSPHLLTGLIVCKHCGYKFTGQGKKGNRGHSYRYYVCSGHLRVGKSMCRSVSVSADELEKLAVDSIRERVKSTNWREGLRPTLKGLLKDRLGEGSENKLAGLRAALQKAEQQTRNVVEAIKAGVPPTTLHEELSKLETHKTELRRDIAHMEGRRSLEKDFDTVLEEILNEAQNFDELWNQCATNEEKKAFLRAFLYQITLDHNPESIKATYYLYNLPQSPKNRLALDTVSGAQGDDSLSLLRGRATK